MTLIRGNRSEGFMPPHSVTEIGPECCAAVSPFFSFMSQFFGLLRFAVIVPTVSCVQSSIFWLDRASYKKYPSTQSAVIKGESSSVSLPAYIRKKNKFPLIASYC
jgi:hypothetical protein